VEDTKKKLWLQDLAFFIAEANKKTWAAGEGKVVAERPGFKEYEYESGLWRLRDSYTGYFRAPGSTTVYYKQRPCWMMCYAGQGLIPGNEARAHDIFSFLKVALMQATPKMPYRGLTSYTHADKCYTFKLLQGDITNGVWYEEITEDDAVVFAQTGLIGIIISKKPNGIPFAPWLI
jgi:hypothetical protein